MHVGKKKEKEQKETGCWGKNFWERLDAETLKITEPFVCRGGTKKMPTSGAFLED